MRVVDPFDVRTAAVAFDRRLDERTDIGRFQMFEFINFADDPDLSVVLKQTDGPDVLFLFFLRRSPVKETRSRDSCRQCKGGYDFLFFHVFYSCLRCCCSLVGSVKSFLGRSRTTSHSKHIKFRDQGGTASLGGSCVHFFFDLSPFVLYTTIVVMYHH